MAQHSLLGRRVKGRESEKTTGHARRFVGSHQYGVASDEVISWSTGHSYPLNADGDDLR